MSVYSKKVNVRVTGSKVSAASPSIATIEYVYDMAHHEGSIVN